MRNEQEAEVVHPLCSSLEQCWDHCHPHDDLHLQSTLSLYQPEPRELGDESLSYRGAE